MNILMMLFNNKILRNSILGIVGAAGLFFALQVYKNNIYQDGYDAAVVEYTAKMLENQRQYQEELTNKLVLLRQELNAQHQLEIARLASESQTDTIVKTITEYVDKEVYVKAECNTVDSDLVSMFNNQITRINTKN